MKLIHYPEDSTPLDPDEIEGLRFKHITTRGELDHLEQANIQSGIDWMRRSKRKNILTENYVCELHKRLFGQVWKWAGTFRRTSKNIGIDPFLINVELRKLLDDLTYWAAHDVYSPYEAALRFHHRLVAIHPFPNGNGRHARIMADAVLIKQYQLPPISWADNDDLQSMDKRRAQYIQALRAADKGDYQLLFSYASVDG
jgi:Fic-DOC domain mobile mystery protein B